MRLTPVTGHPLLIGHTAIFKAMIEEALRGT
jgi:hypothetical protein